MAESITKIKSLARAHTDKAIEVLGGIMAAPKASEAARIAAANSLLDRGWGKATQPHSGDDDAAAIRFEQVRRLIVDPGHTDSASVPAAIGAEPV